MGRDDGIGIGTGDGMIVGREVGKGDGCIVGEGVGI